MGTWKNYIKNLNKEFIGRKVLYDGKQYNVVMVDYNGVIHIDKPSEHNRTTAVYDTLEARKALVQ